jgi:hypothetical protein
VKGERTGQILRLGGGSSGVFSGLPGSYGRVLRGSFTNGQNDWRERRLVWRRFIQPSRPYVQARLPARSHQTIPQGRWGVNSGGGGAFVLEGGNSLRRFPPCPSRPTGGVTRGSADALWAGAFGLGREDAFHGRTPRALVAPVSPPAPGVPFASSFTLRQAGASGRLRAYRTGPTSRATDSVPYQRVVCGLPGAPSSNSPRRGSHKGALARSGVEPCGLGGGALRAGGEFVL